jgi:hypothetical protein
MKIKVISPTHGTHYILIDKKDYLGLNKPGLYVQKCGNFLYARIKPHKTYLHRAILNAPKGLVVDHLNRNTLDNRRSNLRLTSIRGNLLQQKRPDNKTGYTGVTNYGYDKSKYTAQIKVNYKKIHLGVFNTLKEAIVARKKAEKKYGYGIFTKRCEMG